MNAAAPATPTSRDGSETYVRLLLAATAAWAVLWFVHTLGYWEDDAYIHLEFARSLARGQGFSFNGHVVYGDTSPFWVWLLDAFHLAIPNWVAAGKTLTAVACAFALTGAYRFAGMLTRSLGSGESRVFAAMSLLILVVNPYFGYWAFSGMEALAAAGLVCWGLVAAGQERFTTPVAPRRFLLGCVCAGIAPLLRPEMGFFTILLGLVLFLRWVNLPAAFRPKLLLFFSGLAIVAAPGLAWGVYAIRTFGSVLPNTNAAKRAGPQDSVLLHLAGIYAFGFPLIGLGLLALACWFVAHRQWRASISPEALAGSFGIGGWILLVWTAINTLFYLVDHTYVQTRYVFVTAPVLTMAILAVARRWWPRAFLAGAGVGLLFGIGTSLLVTWPLIGNKIGVDREYARLAEFLRSLPAPDAVAHYSIGEAAFLSEHPIVDIGGITRPGVIPFLWDPTDERLVWWMHEQGARYAVYGHAPEPGSTLVWQEKIPSTGWFLRRSDFRKSELLQVWQLPTSPTIPLPSNMPAEDRP